MDIETKAAVIAGNYDMIQKLMSENAELSGQVPEDLSELEDKLWDAESHIEDLEEEVEDLTRRLAMGLNEIAALEQQVYALGVELEEALGSVPLL